LAETLMQVLSEQPPSLWQNTAVIDATLGGGGHSECILERWPGVRLIGLDQDPTARAAAASRLEPFLERVQIVPVNFAAFEPQQPVSLVLADLGVSSPQLDVASRGFSFRLDGPLDMRMNPAAGGETAAEMIERLDVNALADLIYAFGEERLSWRVAIPRKRDGEGFIPPRARSRRCGSP
jgi:16S rRNA (cytosine1402-N4)-methyltransferase